MEVIAVGTLLSPVIRWVADVSSNIQLYTPQRDQEEPLQHDFVNRSVPANARMIEVYSDSAQHPLLTFREYNNGDLDAMVFGCGDHLYVNISSRTLYSASYDRINYNPLVHGNNIVPGMLLLDTSTLTHRPVTLSNVMSDVFLQNFCYSQGFA